MGSAKDKGRGLGADVRGTDAGNRFGEREQAQGTGDDTPLPPENSGVDGPMDQSGRTHDPVTRAEDLDAGVTTGLPDLDIAGFDEDNYSMGTDPKAVGQSVQPNRRERERGGRTEE